MVRLCSPVMSLATADKLFATANNRYKNNAASDEVLALLREVAALDESHLASTAAADGARRRIALDCLQPEFDDDGFPFSTMSCLPCRPNRDAAALTANALLNVLVSSGATLRLRTNAHSSFATPPR